MKTAEEVLNQFVEDKFKDKDGKLPEKTLDALKLTREGKIYKATIEAMKAYALAAIEEDRKDCAFEVTGNLFAGGYGVPDTKILPSILNRPYPQLK